MARRSSARLRARNSATPQPLKTSDFLQDGHIRTPKTAPQLASVVEMEDMPGAFPQSASPADNTPTKLAKHIATAVAGNARTPKHKSPRPSDEEMHPQKFQASTTKPLDEARWLGFSKMGPHTEPPKGVDKWAPTAGTPTKSSNTSGAFEFTFRAQSLELSNEARKLMAEKREEAAKIKQQMARIEEENKTHIDAQGRKIAQPKGKSGRFSEVHMAQFKKMDSIANHASAARPLSRQKTEPTPALKRTGSKAGLHEKSREQETNDKNVSTGPKASSLRRPASEEGGSPAKRARFESPKMSSSLATSVIKVATPSVVSQQTAGIGSTSPGKISYPTLATGTQVPLAKAAPGQAAASTMIPALNRTPSKSPSKMSARKPHTSASTLYARSPTKFAHMSAKKEAPRQDQGPSLLAQSPSKKIGNHPRSASKDEDHTPLLLRSPLRKPVNDVTMSSDSGMKTPVQSQPATTLASGGDPFSPLKSTPGPQANLMDRFNNLRKSPVKSILRSPQRQYSDDPMKIASGTHLATPPPGKTGNGNRPVPRFGPICPATEPVKKHVDFTTSTKASDDSPIPLAKSIIEPGSGYPTLPSYPPLPSEHDQDKARVRRRQTLGPLESKDFTFRVGTGIVFGPSPSATKASPKPSIRHISAEPEPPASSQQRKRKFADAAEDSPSDGPSDKENDANAANIVEPAARPAKRTKTTAPAAVAGPKPVPSWAQGTAAQKARATLAQKHVAKPRATTSTQGTQPKPKPATKEEAKRGAPHVLSRARLEQLSQPKRR